MFDGFLSLRGFISPYSSCLYGISQICTRKARSGVRVQRRPMPLILPPPRLIISLFCSKMLPPYLQNAHPPLSPNSHGAQHNLSCAGQQCSMVPNATLSVLVIRPALLAHKYPQMCFATLRVSTEMTMLAQQDSAKTVPTPPFPKLLAPLVQDWAYFTVNTSLSKGSKIT